MTSTSHPKPLQLPEPQEVLLRKIELLHQGVLDLHPLLELLMRPEDQKDSLGERLAAILKGVKDALEHNTVEMAELKAAVITLTSCRVEEVTDTSHRLRQIEQQLAQISRVLNLKVG